MWAQDMQEMLKVWIEQHGCCLIRSVRANFYGDIVIEADLPDPTFYIWNIHDKTLKKTK